MIGYIIASIRELFSLPGILMVPAVLVTIPLHEMAHGWAAYALGDTTARDRGRLTPNPLAHFDLVGFLCMVFFHFGWAKPVPVDMRYFRIRNRKLGMCIVSIAGPATNLILAAVCAAAFHLVWRSVQSMGFAYYLGHFFYYMAVLNVSLAVFNLIPISPLDGSKILFALLPNRIYYRILQYERYGMLILIALVATGMLDFILDFLRNPLFNLLGL